MANVYVGAMIRLGSIFAAPDDRFGEIWVTQLKGWSWPILLKNSFSGATQNITGPQRRRSFSDVKDHAIFCCAQPGSF